MSNEPRTKPTGQAEGESEGSADANNRREVHLRLVSPLPTPGYNESEKVLQKEEWVPSAPRPDVRPQQGAPTMATTTQRQKFGRSKENDGKNQPSAQLKRISQPDKPSYGKSEKELQPETSLPSAPEPSVGAAKGAPAMAKTTKKTTTRRNFGQSKGTDKIVDPKFQRAVKKLNGLWSQIESVTWELAVHILYIKDKWRLRFGDLRQYLDDDQPKSDGRFSQFYRTAKEFPPDDRLEGMSFELHDRIRRARSRLPKDRRDYFTYDRIAQLVRHHGTDKCRSVGGIFDLCLAVEDKKRVAQLMKAADKIRRKASQILNSYHLADWADILPKLDEDSIDHCFVDPPFPFVTMRCTKSQPTPDGKPSQRIGLLSADCENQSTEDALEQWTSILQRIGKYMKPSGVVTVCCRGGELPPTSIIQAAQSNGLESMFFIPWIKATPQNIGTDRWHGFNKAQMDSIVQTAGIEHIWFLSVDPQSVKRRETESNRPIICLPSPTYELERNYSKGKGKVRGIHLFEHPSELCVELMRRHLAPHSGALVFEPFGCSAPASRAAIRMGLTWIACELNEVNHALGMEKIAEEQKLSKRRTA